MVKQPQHQRYIGRLSVYLRHPRDRDGHPLARVHPRGLDDERHGGEGDPLHHLDARADYGPATHEHVGPGAQFNTITNITKIIPKILKKV